MSARRMLHVHLPVPLHAALKSRAATDGVTMQAWTTRVLATALGGLDQRQRSAIAVQKKGGR